MILYSSNPTSEDPMVWYVWDIYQPLPPKPVFFGAMEDAGLVADALNAREAVSNSSGIREGKS